MQIPKGSIPAFRGHGHALPKRLMSSEATSPSHDDTRKDLHLPLQAFSEEEKMMKETGKVIFSIRKSEGC